MLWGETETHSWRRPARGWPSLSLPRLVVGLGWGAVGPGEDPALGGGAGAEGGLCVCTVCRQRGEPEMSQEASPDSSRSKHKTGRARSTLPVPALPASRVSPTWLRAGSGRGALHALSLEKSGLCVEAFCLLSGAPGRLSATAIPLAQCSYVNASCARREAASVFY